MSPTPSQIIVTTTLWDGPTGSVTSISHSGTTIPVGAIVGGTLGGAFLAILAVTFWMIWGRSIERKQRKEEKERRKAHITAKNTRLNASALSRPRKSNYLPPVFWPASSTKVKFADGGSGTATLLQPDPQPKEKQKAVDPPVPVRRPRPVALSSDPNPTAGVIFPWRKKSVERMTPGRSSPSGSDDSNTSYYSAPSGDESGPGEMHEVDVERGENGPPPDDATHRLSRMSSTWSFLLRNGFRRAPSNPRISQATSASAYSQQSDEPLPVGIAI